MSFPVMAESMEPSDELGLLADEEDLSSSDVRRVHVSSRARGAKVVTGVIMGTALAAAVAVERSAAPGSLRPAAAFAAISLQGGGASCHTAAAGEKCFTEVNWAMHTGIHEHPEWYTGLSASSTFTEFQADLSSKGRGQCQNPCPGQEPALAAAAAPAPAPAAAYPAGYGPAPAAPAAYPAGYGPAPAVPAAVPDLPPSEADPASLALNQCLCLFDVDRTLTTKQGSASDCAGSVEQPGVVDTAFAQGTLVLSPVGRGLSDTFCGQCHRGIISMGSVGGPDEKAAILGASFADAGTVWSPKDNIRSQLVFGSPDGTKHLAAKGIVDWFATKGVTIPADEVYFFDDHVGNTIHFDELGYNARQVSCGTRDPTIGNQVGVCGAQLDEIVKAKGIYNCP